MTDQPTESPTSLVTGPWRIETLPPGWDWIPGYGIYHASGEAARLSLVFTWDELGDLPGLPPYVERQRKGLAGMVANITELGADALDPGGYDEVMLLRLVLDRGADQEVWQEQLYLRLGRTIGVVTASGPADRGGRLREALRFALKLASFSA